MRLLITGGAGCLGSNLVERYLGGGHEILVLDNFATGKREVVPEVNRLKVVEGSVADAELVRRVFADFGPTHVIHSAAAYKDPGNWVEDVSTNVIGSINVVRESIAQGVKRVVNFQTALCYGRPRTIPIPVDHPTAPFTSYGISKVAGEQFMLAADAPVVSLRLANICGPRLAIGPIPTFYQRLKAGKACFCSDTVRDFLDMSDFLSVMDLVLDERTPRGTFNISTGEGRSILDIFRVVASHLGMTPPDVPVVPPGVDDVLSVVLDPSETTRLLGWNAEHGFESTIRRQLAWYDEHGVTDIFSHLAEPVHAGRAQ